MWRELGRFQEPEPSDPFRKILIYGLRRTGAFFRFDFGERVRPSDPSCIDGRRLTDLHDDAGKTFAADFQSKLLRFRLLHFNTVRNSNFECSEISPAMQTDSRALLTPLIDCGDYRKSILSSLLLAVQNAQGPDSPISIV